MKRCILILLILSTLLLAGAGCSRHLGEKEIGVVRVDIPSRSMFPRDIHVHSLDEILAALPQGQTQVIELVFAVNKGGGDLIAGNIDVRRGSVTFAGVSGSLEFLPSNRVLATSMGSQTNLTLPNPTPSCLITWGKSLDGIKSERGNVYSVLQVSAAGQSKLRFQNLKHRLCGKFCIVRLEIRKSNDFEGSVGNWYVPMPW